MVDILSALFGGAYIGVKIEADRRKSDVAKCEIWNHRVSDEVWYEQHTDEALESHIRARMDEPGFYEEVLREVIPAFEQMPSWSYRKDGVTIRADQLSAKMVRANARIRQNFIIRERNIALDIMLANRGKVSTTAANFGYDVFNRALSGGNGLDRRDELPILVQIVLFASLRLLRLLLSTRPLP